MRLGQRMVLPHIQARLHGRFMNQGFRQTVGLFSGVAAGVFLGGVTVVSCRSVSKAEQPPFDVKALRDDIEAIVSENMEYGPLFVRLAWHEAASWDCKQKDGSPNSASMRFKPECAYAGNTGLEKARKALEPLKKSYPSISYADLWVLAAYTSIEYMGGPRIPFSWGRTDAKDGSACGPDGRLPDASKTQSHVRDVFTRLGFNDQETVALIGAHSVGECHLENSGYLGPWTHDKYGFDNSFFTQLLEDEWEINPNVQNLQFMDRATKNLMMLPTDVSLLLDPSYRKYVEMYAKDNDRFSADFSAAYKKLTEVGTTGLKKLSK